MNLGSTLRVDGGLTVEITLFPEGNMRLCIAFRKQVD